MMPALSPNTMAILLLTAPLIAGRGTTSPDLLSPGEYKRLARHLRDLQREPADLVSPDSADLLRACRPLIDESRLQRLLGRGFLLSQVIERWQARAIWVVSRADAEYPRRLKARLRENAPAVIYGCGDTTLLQRDGLAVVGSRHVDDAMINYAMEVGRLAAQAERTLVSGGARGIDQAAMRGAIEAGGKVTGVLADSLEKTAMNREHRNLLLGGQLVLISPYDPSAGFNVGNAMQRNKLIYALAEASLVVSSDLNKGGTWTGAVEQLEKLKLVPVYVRSTEESSPGLEALKTKGALPWPNPQDAATFRALLERPAPEHLTPLPTGVATVVEDGRSRLESNGLWLREPMAVVKPPSETVRPPAEAPVDEPFETTRTPARSDALQPAPTSESGDLSGATPTTPADTLFAVVRSVIPRLLTSPKKDAEVAAALEVSAAQAKAWLQRLVDEGVVEKPKKQAGYALRQYGRQPSLFE